MMREKYESLPLATLKDLAKARGLKGISTMKKAELIERMLEEDEKEKKSARETVKELSANTGDKEVHDIDKLEIYWKEIQESKHSRKNSVHFYIFQRSMRWIL